MLCVPVVHAVVMAIFGPRYPYIMDKCPDTMLIMLEGTKNGETLFGPRSKRTWWQVSMVLIPPIPDPIATPTLDKSESESSSPE